MITINVRDESVAAKIVENIDNVLDSKEYKHFIRDKAMKELNRLTSEKISNISEEDVRQFATGTYANAHRSRVDKNSITIWNGSTIDVDNENYPDHKLSLAKIIEFGTGIVGDSSEAKDFVDEQGGWEYDVNNHGEAGWSYNKNGRFYHTKGVEGKLIYHTLADVIRENIGKWTEEYLKKVVR